MRSDLQFYVYDPEILNRIIYYAYNEINRILCETNFVEQQYAFTKKCMTHQLNN